MKIQNNSIIHELKDKVYYQNQIYTIIKIQEDIVHLQHLNQFKYVRTNIFNIKGIK
jgi:hypothetical protein